MTIKTEQKFIKEKPFPIKQAFKRKSKELHSTEDEWK